VYIKHEEILELMRFQFKKEAATQQHAGLME
jgi:hypothetical protein